MVDAPVRYQHSAYGGGISDSGAKKVADADRGCTRLPAFYPDCESISGETLVYTLEGMAGISTVQA